MSELVTTTLTEKSLSLEINSTPDGATNVSEQSADYVNTQEVNNPTNGGGDCDDNHTVFVEPGIDVVNDDSIKENISTESPMSADVVLASPDSLENGEVKKKRLSVNFPQDHSLVSGKMDPPDPWKNVHDWTTPDLIAAYRKACEQIGIRPSAKLIQQLQFIENDNERHETLSLKGEKLDQRHCECFEEIFRRVQFKTVDLESAHLDDECAVALFDMIEYYESAQKINISFNKNINVRGWQACARLIKKTPSLTHLDARNCEFTEPAIPILGRSLRMGAFLVTLHLENTYLSGRRLMILVAALKINEVLQELFLADNKLVASDAVQLGNLLKCNHKLSLLDLRNNHIQDVGVGHISDGLTEQNIGIGLNTLVLWNNHVSYQGVVALARALISTESLETLNLGHNPVTNEGIHRLKDGLLKNKSLLRIGLQGTKLTCEGAIALAEYLADNARLLRLDLRENDLKTAGLMALSLALKVNDTLTKLDVDKEMKKESGMKDYAEQQKRLQQDINHFLARNRDMQQEREEAQQKLAAAAAAVAEKEGSGVADLLEPVAISNTGSMSMSVEEMGQDLDLKSFECISSISATAHRPTSLFSAQLSRQTSLESPGNFSGDITSQGSDRLPHLSFSSAVASASATVDREATENCKTNTVDLSVSSKLHTDTAVGEMLLSPQYCAEKMSVKKLFSVSKVENALAAGSDICSEFLGSFMPVTVPLCESPDPHLLSNKKLFYSDYQNAKLDNENDIVHEEKSVASGVSVQNSDEQPSSVHSMATCANPAPKSQFSVNNQSELCDSNTDVDSDYTSDNIVQSTNGYASLSQNNHTNTRLSIQSCDPLINQQTRIGDQITSHSVIGKSVNDSDSELKAELSYLSTVHEPVTVFANLGTKGVKGVDLPDFHSAMSVNGMTQELAMALENLDASADSAEKYSKKSTTLLQLDEHSAPDDFERELDAMLATIQHDAWVPGDKISGSSQMCSEKTPEALIQEMIDNPAAPDH